MNSEVPSRLKSPRSRNSTRKTRRKRRVKKRIKSSMNCGHFPVDVDECLNNETKSVLNYTNRDMFPIWFWTNYRRCLQWKNRHDVALWKSYALALHNENKYLLQVIAQLRTGQDCDDMHIFCHNGGSDVGKTACIEKSCRLSRGHTRLSKQEDEHSMTASDCDVNNDDEEEEEEEEESCVQEEIAFEMSDEMIKFFQQSFKHKLELSKSRESDKQKMDSELKKCQTAHEQRAREMKLLYGNGSSMIIGMETAVQLSFDKYCDVRSPQYWPNIPLNI